MTAWAMPAIFASLAHVTKAAFVPVACWAFAASGTDGTEFLGHGRSPIECDCYPKSYFVVADAFHEYLTTSSPPLRLAGCVTSAPFNPIYSSEYPHLAQT